MPQDSAAVTVQLEQSNYTPQLTLKWFANTTFKISLTSAVISVINTPISAAIAYLQVGKAKNLSLPSMALKSLGSNIVTGQQRGAVTMGAKLRAVEEVPCERVETGAINKRVIETLGFSQVEIAATQIYGNKAKLAAINVINSSFKWSFHNAKELFTMAYPLKTISGAINFASLCLLSDKISKALPFENPLANNLLGGAASGVIATAVAHLPTSGADYIINNATVDSKGQISRMTSQMFFKSQVNYLKEVGISKAITPFLLRSLTHLPLKSIGTVVAFAIIQSASLLGDEPLTDLMSVKK